MFVGSRLPQARPRGPVSERMAAVLKHDAVMTVGPSSLANDFYAWREWQIASAAFQSWPALAAWELGDRAQMWMEEENVRHRWTVRMVVTW